ncbi:hypothetical protein [Fredinandcohnia sp. 179-A 10B2 NHS]|uniref:hypothetical protein n=1 Tax=Fredinandcohnia sp. 179-A 10B2 NHS TaxID=3235176 RepID=UPI0039A3B03F
MKRLVPVFVAIILFLSACYADGERVTVRSVLKTNPEADILQLDNGKVYSNMSKLEWFQDMKKNFSKGEEIGEVKKQTTSHFWFKDFYATKLPKGTKVYSTNSLGVVIVIYKEEELYYMELLEE